MTVKDIFVSALCLLAESTSEADTEDYAERAPYLVAAFCTEAQDTDEALRVATGAAEAPQFNAVYISLEDDFPLLKRFTSAAAYYLAAMLVIDEDEQLSDRLYDKYSDAMSTIRQSIPAQCESINDSYCFS